MSGLYDGEFVGFKISTSEERDQALREAVVAVDANVLLDLYRFRPQTSQDLIKVLVGLGDRLVVPHQALREFWRHRQRHQASPRTATDIASEALGRPGRAMISALATWAKQVGIDDPELAEMTDRVETFIQSLQSEIQQILEDTEGRQESDPILAELERLLDGRVTDPLVETVWEECVTEARRRISAEEPPGYKDAKKDDENDTPEGAAGDYLVWYQATRYAKDKNSDLVIVTRDEKEDWWWRQGADFIGPRQELVYEYHQLSGRRLFLMRPSDLLARAEVLKVEVDTESSRDADRPADAGDDSPAEPWTHEAVAALLAHLDREGSSVQAAALRLATPAREGRVTREQIYELGGYSDDRVLRGFTRPFQRLTGYLQNAGVVPVNVAPIFVARYPDGVRASFFSVPPEVSRILEGFNGGGQEPSGSGAV